MDEERLWSYIARLEKAIRASMEQSDEIAEIIALLQERGIQVTLNCVAQFVTPEGMVIRPPSAQGGEEGAGTAERPEGRLRFGLDESDRRFLDELGLRFD